MRQILSSRDSNILPSRVFWEGRVPQEAGNGVVAGVLLFVKIISLVPDSSDISLMEADVLRISLF